jgi:alpha-L-fucosidase
VVGGSFNDTATQPYTSQDIRFTTKGDVLYAIALGWPADGKIAIKTLSQGSTAAPGSITSVKLLGSNAKLKWIRDGNGLNIELPQTKTGEYAWAFRIERSSR